MSEVSNYFNFKRRSIVNPENESEVDRYFKERVELPKQKLRSSMLEAAKSKPDQYADVVKLADRTSLPEDVVERNVELVSDKERRDSDLYDQLIDSSPGTASFLSDKTNAKLAHDDVEALRKYEAANFNVSRKTPIEKPFYDFWESPVGSALTIVGDLARSIPSESIGLAGHGMQGLAQYTKSLNEVYPEFFDYLHVPDESFADVERRAGYVTEIGESLSQTAKEIGVPKERQNILTMGVGGLGQVLNFAVAPIPTLVAFSGSSYKSGEDKALAAGEDKETALAVGTLYAVSTLVSEKIGMDFLLKRIAPMVRNSTLRKLFDTVIGSAIEGSQELVERVMHQLIDKGIYDPTAKIDIIPGKEEGAAAITAAISRLITGGVRSRAQHKAQEARVTKGVEELKKIREAAVQSKLFTRHKGKFEEFAKQAAEQGDDPNIYIDAEAVVKYFNEKGEGVEQAFEALGVTGQAQEALSRGGKLVVPVSKFISTYGDTEHFDSLLNDVAIYQGDSTLNELKYEKDTIEEELLTQAETINAASEAQQVGQEIESLFREQMVDIYDPGIVDQYATLHKMIASRAVADGIATPEQMRKYYNLDVTEEAAEAGLEQAKAEGYEGESEQEASEWVSAMRKYGKEGMTQDARMKRAKEMGFDVDKVMYHGSNANISRFDPNYLGKHTAANSAKQGFFFAADPFTSQSYIFGDSAIWATHLGDEAREVKKRIAKEKGIAEWQVTDYEAIQQMSIGKFNKRIEEIKKELRNINPVSLFPSNKKLSNDELIREAELKKELQAIEAGVDFVTRSATAKDSVVDDDVAAGNWSPIDPAKGSEPNIMPMYLAIKNPLVYDFQRGERDISYAELLEQARNEGKDGAIFKNTTDGAGVTDIYVAFDPSQIRSVNAAFDPDYKESGNLLAQKKASQIEVTTTETNNDTGEVVQITERGDMAYKRTKQKMQAFQDMIKCLKG